MIFFSLDINSTPSFTNASSVSLASCSQSFSSSSSYFSCIRSVSIVLINCFL